MNFKSTDKFYLVLMFIFCLFNPIYFFGIFIGYHFINFEERIYENISKKNRKMKQINSPTIYDDWPTTGVSKEVKLENKIRNQQMKLMRTNSIEDVKILNFLEKELEDFYNKKIQNS